jgi:hypothetical protein
MIKLVLQMCHDSPMGGHSGIQNTIDRVREFYFFQRLPTIVAEQVMLMIFCFSTVRFRQVTMK